MRLTRLTSPLQMRIHIPYAHTFIWCVTHYVRPAENPESNKFGTSVYRGGLPPCKDSRKDKLLSGAPRTQYSLFASRRQTCVTRAGTLSPPACPCICICIYIYIYVYIYVYVCISLSLCIYIYMYDMYMHIYIIIYIYMYIYTHTHVHTYRLYYITLIYIYIYTHTN